MTQDANAESIPRHHAASWLTSGFAVVILLPSMYGFVGKFVELIHVYRGEPGGAFAVAPMINYLLASTGFFCMLLWATRNGMFRDIEQPKLAFLQREEELDAHS